MTGLEILIIVCTLACLAATFVMSIMLKQMKIFLTEFLAEINGSKLNTALTLHDEILNNIKTRKLNDTTQKSR